MKKIIITGLIGVFSFLSAYEPSVYGAGDIESATPYGLTQTEQVVLENKKMLQMLHNKITEQQRKVEGLTSIINGQNKEILTLKESLEVLSNDSKANKPDANRTYSLLLELGQMVDNINNNYVSKEELNGQLQAGSSSNITPSLNAPSTQSYIPQGNITQNVENISDVYRKGVQLFSKGSYRAAGEHFSQALAENYKSAASNYYLGEVAYYTQNYKNAVAYYKQSASLYDKATYMAVLYLHTAISLNKSGEQEQARGFFQHVVDSYPNTKSASIARNRM